MSLKRMLAFGDSLTAGYYLWGCKFRPYSTRLQELLGQNWAIKTTGHSGYTTEELLGELPTELKVTTKFDVVAILAGTNDLGFVEGEEIKANLRKLHSLAYDTGARTIAITIPEMSVESSEKRIREKRVSINKWLAEFAAGSAGRSTLFDLATSIPYESLKEQERDELWDDGVHFRPAGYDKFGELLHKHLVEHKLAVSSVSSSDASVKRDAIESKSSSAAAPSASSVVAASAAASSGSSTASSSGKL